MKTNLVKTMSVAALFAGLAMIPSVANASLEIFTWAPDNTRPLPENFLGSSGTLEFNTVSGDITGFSFGIQYLGSDNTYDAFSGTYVLTDGDLALTGFSYDSDAFLGIPDVGWAPTHLPQPDEEVGGVGFVGLFGDWVYTSTVSDSQAAPVPEPTTVFAGAMLLLPLGLGAVRSLRKNRNA
jgi:hypothetical protein